MRRGNKILCKMSPEKIVVPQIQNRDLGHLLTRPDVSWVRQNRQYDSVFIKSRQYYSLADPFRLFIVIQERAFNCKWDFP